LIVHFHEAWWDITVLPKKDLQKALHQIRQHFLAGNNFMTKTSISGIRYLALLERKQYVVNKNSDPLTIFSEKTRFCA